MKRVLGRLLVHCISQNIGVVSVIHTLNKCDLNKRAVYNSLAISSIYTHIYIHTFIYIYTYTC